MRSMLVVAAALAGVPLSAQDVGNSGTIPPEIVVTGRGLPDTPATPAYSEIELDREQIVTVPSGGIEGALDTIAGVQQFRRSDSRSANPSAQGITLRSLGGNATSRALVLLDKVPIADPFFGYIPFNALAPERLASITVTKGGGSGPFGSGALTGTIELESAQPRALSPISASLFANDRHETQASALASRKLGAGYVTIGGRWDRGQGFFTTPDAQRVPATSRARFDAWSLDGRAVVPLGPSLALQARALHFDDQRTLRFEGADSTSRGTDASVRLVGTGRWAFDAVAYLQARNFSNVVISSTRFVPVLNQRNTPSTGLGAKVEVRPPVAADHALRLGIDYRRADGQLAEEAISAFSGQVTERRRAGGVNSDVGLFIENDWSLGTVVLTGGVRLDRTRTANGFFQTFAPDGKAREDRRFDDRTQWTLGYRAGAVWQASDRLRLRAVSYSGLRVPTLNELYRPFVVFPVVTQANAGLQNERLLGLEGGVDWEPSAGLELSVTAFANDLKDAIANVTLAENLRQRRNLPAIEARGVEGAFALKTGSIEANATMSFTDAAVRGRDASAQIDGLRPSQSPRFAAAATVAWRPARNWLLAVQMRHTGAQFESDLETDRLPPTTTVGAYAAIPAGNGFSLVIRGENLTDEPIVTRNSGGSIDLGVPRTIWVGVRFGY